MNHRTLTIHAGLMMFAVGTWSLTTLHASDCNCAKPKVIISAEHQVNPPEAIKVYLGDGDGTNFEQVVSDPEGQELERDKIYRIKVELYPTTTEISGCADVLVKFPSCSMQHSDDGNPDSMHDGTSATIRVYSSFGQVTYEPEYISICITDSLSDDPKDFSSPGGEANAQSSPATCSYANNTWSNEPPGVGFEIPMGAAHTPQGYRSAGRLVNYGPLSGSRAAPSNLHYNGISGVGSQVSQLEVTCNSISEKHFVGPQCVMRLVGWSGTNVVSWQNAAGSLVEVYEPSAYNSNNHSFTGSPISYYRLEPVTETGFDGVRLVQSNNGLVRTRSFLSSTDGLTLKEINGPRVTTTVAIPDTNGGNWQSEITSTDHGVVVSHVIETHKPLGTAYVVTSRTEYLDQTSGLTTNTWYYNNGRVRAVERPDGSWTYNDETNPNISYGPWLSIALAGDELTPALPSGAVIQTINTNTPDVNSTESAYLASPTSNDPVALSGTATVISEPIGSDYATTSHITRRNDSDIISYSYGYKRSYAESGTNDRFMAGRTLMTWDMTGRATRYEYTRGDWSGSSFTENTSGTALKTSATTGHVSNPSGSSTIANFSSVAGHSTTEVTITADVGVVREETYVGGSSSPVVVKVHEYEAGGQRRHTGVKINGVYISRTVYVSPSITRQYDETGAFTETEINALGEVVRTTTSGDATVPPVTTIYNRSGLTTTTRVNGQAVSVETLDLLGRVVSRKDASGAEVTTSYGSGGCVVTNTAPGGVTTIEERHFDGRPISTTGSGVIPRYHSYSVSGGRITTTTHTGTATSSRVTSITSNQDGSTHSESSPNPADGGSTSIVRSYQYASGSTALLRVSSTAGNSARVEINPAASDEAAMGHYSLSGIEIDGNGPVVSSGDRLTETAISYGSSGGVYNRQTVTKVFNTNGSDVGYVRTTLEAVAPTTVSHQYYGDGLRWVSSSSNGITTVTTTRDVFPGTATVVTSTNDSATAVSPDSVSISRHGREVSRSAYGADNPETMAYDAAGHMILHTSVTKADTQYVYNDAGQLIRTIDHMGKATEYQYYPNTNAAAGLLHITTNPEGETTETGYNSRGQVTSIGGTATYPVTYDYNEFGERDEMRTFRSAGSGDLTQWGYDEATGLLLTKTDAADKTTTYTYYSTGQVHTRTRARTGSVTTYAYNDFGDLTGTTYSDSTPAVAITPDRLGRPHVIADASGTRTLDYHSVTGGLDNVSYSSGSLLASIGLDYTWDTSLRPAGYTVSNNGPAASVAYDSAGRWDGVSANGNSHSYDYIDGTGTLSNVSTSRNNSQVLVRSLYHDRMQRLRSISNSNGSSAVLTRHAYALDDVGRRVSATRENGQRWDYAYADRGQVTSAVKKFPGDDGDPIPGHTFGYSYDGIGNRTSATLGGTGNAVTYTADEVNQYTGGINTEGGRFILGEAPVDNDVFINGDTEPTPRTGGSTFFAKHIDGVNTNGPLWSLDTIVSNSVTVSGYTWTPSASVTPVHDDDGNLTFDGRWNYSWDAENRLVRMETTNAAATAGVPRQRLDFAYDSQHRRVAKDVSTSSDGINWSPVSAARFLYDDWNLIAEYSVESSTLVLKAAHVWGVDLSNTPQGAGGVGGLLCSMLVAGDQTVNSYFPAFDGNGNISAWVNASGALVGRMDYSPFGQLIAQYKFTLPGDNTLSRLRFGFSTKYTDAESGLLYYGYRYLDPVSGRWLSRDPIGEKGGINLYGFVENDGVDIVDVLGLIEATFFSCKAKARWSLTTGIIDLMAGNMVEKVNSNDYPAIGSAFSLEGAAKQAMNEAGLAAKDGLLNHPDPRINGRWAKALFAYEGIVSLECKKCCVSGEFYPPSFSLDCKIVDAKGIPLKSSSDAIITDLVRVKNGRIMAQIMGNGPPMPPPPPMPPI